MEAEHIKNTMPHARADLKGRDLERRSAGSEVVESRPPVTQNPKMRMDELPSTSLVCQGLHHGRNTVTSYKCLESRGHLHMALLFSMLNAAYMTS